MASNEALKSQAPLDAESSGPVRKQASSSWGELEHLVVYQEPPKSPIVGEYFPVQIWILDFKNQLVRGRHTPLKLTLQKRVGEGPLEPIPDFDSDGVENIVVTPTAKFKLGDDIVHLPCIDWTGQINLWVKVNLKPKHEDEEYSLLVQALSLELEDSDATPSKESSQQVNKTVPPSDPENLEAKEGDTVRKNPPIPDKYLLENCTCTSSSFRTYRFRLHNSKTLPDDWLRDRGGRRNCLELGIELHGKYSKPVKDQLIPIRVQLEYEGGAVVADQKLIQVLSPPSAVYYVDWRGKIDINCRINEVSRRHEGRKFVIAVFADTKLHPNAQDVAPVRSNPVRVLSKFNKSRQRARDLKREAKRRAIEEERLQFLSSFQGVSKEEENPIAQPANAVASNPTLSETTSAGPAQVQTVAQGTNSVLSLGNNMGSLLEQRDALSTQLKRTQTWKSRIDTFLDTLRSNKVN